MKLNNKTLSQITVKKPDYDRGEVSPGIVHLGIGGFHRAHLAVTVDNLLAKEPDWGIIGASLRSCATADALNPQHGLYTLIEKSEAGVAYRVIASVLEVIAACDNGEQLLAKMIDPAIRIVSLTVTEKGYCHDPDTAELNLEHPDILADLASPESPRSAPGFLVEALRRRRDNGDKPFTVLSCDNLPSNGRVCRQVVLALAGQLDTGLADWIEARVSFPCTMVDRIVPATTDVDRRLLTEQTGISDHWPVVTEAFSQCVVEDDFCVGRPAFECHNIQMVSDVAAFETMKLRLLNGSHSALAYLGSLAGYETVAQAMQDNQLVQFIESLMGQELAPTLNMPTDIDLKEYQSQLLKRFRNPGLQHQLLQIATDGSQKLPQRILSPIRERLSQGLPIPRLARCIAGWIAFISCRDGTGFRFPLRDPLGDEMRQQVMAAGAAPVNQVKSILSLQSVFGDLAASEELFEAVIRQFHDISGAK
ncbi:MAG: mannitol dehydrogenase family protein [Gammaproteobacteria bacterium]|nr:mannitol dehydrogenase family protein [Gammaproteobacteria bacterium]